jgi:hypothetical protein
MISASFASCKLWIERLLRHGSKDGGKILAILLAGILPTSPAYALIDQTWISVYGVDSGSCSGTAPCATLAYALRQTSTGGTVFVMDSGYYGAATIDRSMTIRSEYGQMTMITSLTINTPSTGQVVVDNVAIECAAPARGITYSTGVKILRAADVLLNHVSIKDCASASSVAAGVYIYSTTNCRVTINDSVIFNNPVGVLVSSTDGMAHAKIYRTLFLSNSDRACVWWARAMTRSWPTTTCWAVSSRWTCNRAGRRGPLAIIR